MDGHSTKAEGDALRSRRQLLSKYASLFRLVAVSYQDGTPGIIAGERVLFFATHLRVFVHVPISAVETGASFVWLDVKGKVTSGLSFYPMSATPAT